MAPYFFLNRLDGHAHIKFQVQAFSVIRISHAQRLALNGETVNVNIKTKLHMAYSQEGATSCRKIKQTDSRFYKDNTMFNLRVHKQTQILV